MPETAHQLVLPLETHRNHYLFSDHYLNELLPRQAVWRETEAEAQQALEAITVKNPDWQVLFPHAPHTGPARNAGLTSVKVPAIMLCGSTAVCRSIVPRG